MSDEKRDAFAWRRIGRLTWETWSGYETWRLMYDPADDHFHLKRSTWCDTIFNITVKKARPGKIHKILDYVRDQQRDYTLRQWIQGNHEAAAMRSAVKAGLPTEMEE